MDNRKELETFFTTWVVTSVRVSKAAANVLEAIKKLPDKPTKIELAEIGKLLKHVGVMSEICDASLEAGMQRLMYLTSKN